ncbi:MAG: tRNA 2-thiocytidine(32) synthetase TtcA, partial [Syntrophobacteraceae bacterium]|nr:tRNA 2-thiocytidine(32) synthetase TtcA [Syntrophobacteraceae bacterium]
MTAINRETRHLLGKAVHHYGLIEDGDRIAVAVSGGKDSLVLLWLLRERLKWIPARYQLLAIHVDPGFDTETSDTLRGFFLQEGFEHRIIHTDQGPRAHAEGNRENPCFLCSRLRRKVLFETARENGCGKIALGHNQDDLIETFFINILYAGQLAGIVPRQPFFGGEIVVIRPLAYCKEKDIDAYARIRAFPLIPCNLCGSQENLQRQAMKEMLRDWEKRHPGRVETIFKALQNVAPSQLADRSLFD